MNGDVYPWIRGNLTIARAVLEDIEQHALECYPSESCGFLAGPVTEALWIDRNIREVNEADKYHLLDPETFPRDSKTYFKINELRASRAFENGEKTGFPIKAIYHSHCDAGAYFSQEDAATFARDHQLTWPCSFVVVSVLQGKVVDRRLWIHKAGSNDFEESTMSVR